MKNEQTEIRVRPITRYIVTTFTSSEHENGRGGASSATLGEASNLRSANEMAKAFGALNPAAKVTLLPEPAEIGGGIRLLARGERDANAKASTSDDADGWGGN